jgi:L-ascorbate metabolism protein UlaG (beta-lactamase superfamily)
MSITMVGHSTVLIETGGLRMLTDPYFGRRGNPAYARLRPPAMTREEVGPVDVVLLSHNHWDHTDRGYFGSLGRNVPVLAPRRSGWVTRMKGAKTVVGMKPWGVWTIGEIDVHAVPALHPATSIGYVIRSEGTGVYFAGDTYYRPFMAEIRNRFSPDVALMPVTTYRIPMTMGEKSAVRASLALGVAVVIPIHLGVQPRSPLLRTRQTPEGFARRLAEVQPSTQVVRLGEGESWDWRGNQDG